MNIFLLILFFAVGFGFLIGARYFFPWLWGQIFGFFLKKRLRKKYGRLYQHWLPMKK